MKTICMNNRITGQNGVVEITTTYHSTKGRVKFFRTVAVEELRGLISEAKSYDEEAAMLMHREVVKAAIAGADCYVPNDVKYYRAKAAS